MATKSNRSGAGGGPASRQVKNNQAGRKVEPNPRAVSPGAVSQIGSSMGNHATDAGQRDETQGWLSAALLREWIQGAVWRAAECQA